MTAPSPKAIARRRAVEMPELVAKEERQAALVAPFVAALRQQRASDQPGMTRSHL
jgi:hypothetical protein